MNHMNFKKESYLWIVIIVIFLYTWIETENIFSAFLLAGIVLGAVYLIYILLRKFFK